MHGLETQMLDWLGRYGYGAAIPAVVSDPVGIPWAWVFLMLLCQQAGKSVVAMLLVGFATLWACDVALYFVGLKWGTKLLAWLGRTRPAWKKTLDDARDTMRKRGAVAVIIGRYLPLIGRWIGLGAGMAQVPPLRFVLYSAVGAAVYVFGFGVPAHLLGRKIVGNPLLMPLALGVCIAGMAGGLLFVGWSAWKSKRAQKSAAASQNVPAPTEI